MHKSKNVAGLMFPEMRLQTEDIRIELSSIMQWWHSG